MHVRVRNVSVAREDDPVAEEEDPIAREEGSVTLLGGGGGG